MSTLDLIKNALDILIVAILLFQLYKIFKGTRSMNIFIAAFGFVVLWFIVKYGLGMMLLGTIMDAVMGMGAIILIVLFQDEIKYYLYTFGNGSTRGFVGHIRKYFFKSNKTNHSTEIDEIVESVENCAATHTGMLIVFQSRADLYQYSHTGEIIESKTSARLIENLFFKNTPLHDGALIIKGGTIVAAGCILPVSHNLNIPKHYGLRHRAALGISEKTDATAVVVSEETGLISVAQNGTIRSGITADELRNILHSIL